MGNYAKNYLCLNNKEKNLVCNFINRNEENLKTLEVVEKECTTEVHGYGKGTLFMFNKNKVIARAYVVLEVVQVMKVIYIHYVDILEEVKNKEEILEILINQCKELSTEYKVEKILLGIRNEEILKVAESIGLVSEYSSFNMVLDDKDIKESILDLVALSKENINEYIKIYNSSFMDMPHGTYIDEGEANEYLAKEDKSNGYFIVSNGEINIGFMNTIIENNEGYFDIGLCKEYRGMGYGKRLLETAIDYLKREGTEKICLTVIEKNTVAFQMYKKRGFRVQSNLSRWIDVQY